MGQDEMKSNRAARRATPLLETISSLLASTFLYPPSFLGLDFLSAPFFFPFLSLYLSPFLLTLLFSSTTPRPLSTLSLFLLVLLFVLPILEGRGKHRERERSIQTLFYTERRSAERAAAAHCFIPLPQSLGES